jgi:hypothetical protein
MHELCGGTQLLLVVAQFSSPRAARETRHCGKKSGFHEETRPFSAFIFRGGKPAGSKNHVFVKQNAPKDAAKSTSTRPRQSISTATLAPSAPLWFSLSTETRDV